LLVGGGLGGEVSWVLTLLLLLCDVFAPFESGFAETPGGLDGDDGELAEGRQFAGVLDLLPFLGDLDADAGASVGVLESLFRARPTVTGLGFASWSSDSRVYSRTVAVVKSTASVVPPSLWTMKSGILPFSRVRCAGMMPRCSRYTA
jgi:hypothetical protein